MSFLYSVCIFSNIFFVIVAFLFCFFPFKKRIGMILI